MNTMTTMFLIALMSPAALAGSALLNNPHLPYPPACGRLPDLDAPGGIESQAVMVADREVNAIAYATDGILPVSRSVPLTLRAYRAPCSEADRSLVWLEFTLAEARAGEELKIPLPSVTVMLPGHWGKSAALTLEPNGWASAPLGWDREQLYLVTRPQGLQDYYGTPSGDRRWVFLLDNMSPLDEWWAYSSPITVADYNGAFDLRFQHAHGDALVDIHVPATAEVLFDPMPGFPLSGRLSGNWVIPGSADQGVMLSITERVQPDVPGVANTGEGPMVVFLAHYTYDAAGDMLWLTGAAQVQPGVTEVTIPIERVTNGEFRGARRADRALVGSVTLTSNSCNQIGFEYDYTKLGLGAGDLDLQRLFSLEIAGHECRDFEARRAAMK